MIGKYLSVDRGFTIIELMVSIAVLSVIVAIVAASLIAVADTSEIAREAAQELRVRQFISRSLNINLTSLYVDPACVVPDYKLVGVNEDGAYGPADTISFCVALPMPGTRSLPGVIRRVSYGAATGYESSDAQNVAGTAGLGDEETQYASSSESKEEMILLIRQEPLTVSDPDSTGLDLENEEKELVEQQVPIRSIDIEYYHGYKEEWVDEWDSETEGFLPWAVHIKINFARSHDENSALMGQGIDPDDDPDFDMTFVLPIGAGVIEEFLDNNHMRSIVEDLEEPS